MNVAVKLINKQILKEVLLVAILISISVLYSFQSLNRITVLCALVLLILLFTHRFLPDTKSLWIIKFALVSMLTIIFANSSLSALYWII